MNLEEVARLLFEARRVDQWFIRGEMTEEIVRTWHGYVGHLDYGAAHAALKRHYSGSGASVKPADIIALVNGAPNPGRARTCACGHEVHEGACKPRIGRPAWWADAVAKSRAEARARYAALAAERKAQEAQDAARKRAREEAGR